MKKNTGLTTSGFVIFSFLTSCLDENPAVMNVLPAKEIHYNFETGEKLGEKTLSYDNQGNLVLEYYDDFISPLQDKEIKHEYDANGNQIKTMYRDPNISDKYWTDVFIYENGLKKSESSFYDGKSLGYQTLYFYSTNIIDSTQLYYYSTIEEEYKYMRTTFYEVDALERVIKAYEKTGKGITLYRYERDKLMETCNLITGLTEVSEDCIKNEYNNVGKLIKISSTSPWRNELQEELFYKDNVLDEKKVYSYPAYDPGNTIDVTLIKYAY
ncbi:MAG: hypothetical protein C0490_03285 [Marivirga sp.]|nr:hypothetical protein [Marivirga sp.]